MSDDVRARDFQTRTFNRTGRRKIADRDVDAVHDADAGTVTIRRLEPGDWALELGNGGEDAVVHFDLTSALYRKRQTAGKVSAVVRPDWPGVTFTPPAGVFASGRPVELEAVAVDFNGLIRARSASLRLFGGSGGERAGAESLLAFQQSADEQQALWSLTFENVDRPTVLLPRRLNDWRSFKETAAFRFAVLPAAVRAVLLDLAFLPDRAWREDWLGLNGVKGCRERLPNFEEEDIGNPAAYVAAAAWADEATEAFCAAVAAHDKFTAAQESEAETRA